MNPAPTVLPTSRTLQRDATRRQLVQAGLRLVAERGFAGATTAAIAEASGKAHGTVFVHFRTRDVLVAELVAEIGKTMSQQLAQTRDGARGALLMYSCLPVSEFGAAWPAGVPVQVHGKEADEFFLEDIDAARALVESSDQAELFLYPGEEHLFADSSLQAFDPAAAARLTERVLAFLERIPADETG